MGQRFDSLSDELKRRLSLAGDLIILNFLFFICSIPVFTAGAAAVACYTSIFRILRREQTGISFKVFFRDFAAGFKKGTLAWLIEIGCLIIIAGDCWFAVVYSNPRNTFFLIFAIVLAAVILFAATWLYPLIARFENRLGTTIKNSFLMALAQFPRTLLVLLIQVAFLAVPFVFFNVFVLGGWFWLLFGASLPMFLTAKLFGSTLQCKHEETNTDEQKKE